VVLDDHSNLDVLASRHRGRSRSALVRFRVRFGRIIGRTVHLVDRSMDEDDARSSRALLPISISTPTSVPPVVVARTSASFTSPLMREYLSEVRGRPVEVVAAQRGKRRRVLELAKTTRKRSSGATPCVDRAITTCARAPCRSSAPPCTSKQPPYRIECFDMSHLQGTNYVGSMVVFEDALPSRVTIATST
jgi:excinuclease ABC subunit C